MPMINRGQRFFALPLIAALASSGLLVGSAGTSAASTAASGTTVAAAPVASKNLSLQQRKQIRKNKIRRAVRVARNQIGDPYVYGAAGPGAFDCSGLTSFAFGKAGISLPRSSDAQGAHVNRIAKSRMQRGDLMFFHSGGGVYHVGIYMGRDHGDRIILHSSRSGRPVQKDPVWTSSWFGGTLRIRG